MFKDSLSDRLKTAAEARKKALENFRAKAKPDDPAVVERQAARQAIGAAREIRAAERKVAKEAEAERQAADRAEREAEATRQAAEQAAREAAAEEEAKARQITLAAEQKAARDARYAARKARR